MSNTAATPPTLDREYLEIRARILELAAAFDRLDRADDTPANDPRLAALHKALEAVLQSQPNRAEQVQLVFSRKYDRDWRKNL